MSRRKLTKNVTLDLNKLHESYGVGLEHIALTRVPHTVDDAIRLLQGHNGGLL